MNRDAPARTSGTVHTSRCRIIVFEMKQVLTNAVELVRIRTNELDYIR
jgi:hypothetical protein